MRKLFLIPTRLGRYLLGLNFLIFILAISYSNNLLLLFSLFLIGQTIYWYIETIRHQHQTLGRLEIPPVYLGEATYLKLEIRQKKIESIKVIIDNQKYFLKMNSALENEGLFPVMMRQRGKYLLQKISFFDSAPFGLFAKKLEQEYQQSFFIYPHIYPHQSPTHPYKKEHQTGPLEAQTLGNEDFYSLDKYQSEDFKKISWKHFARMEELYVKKGSSQESRYLDLILKENMNEEDISYVATQIYLAHKYQILTGLKTPDEFISYGEGDAHFKELMEKVAQW